MDAMGQSGHQKALKLLTIYHGGVDDFFKLWPPDKLYFFAKDGKAFLAYQVKNNVAVCMGDPVGRQNSIPALLDEFHQHCAAKHLSQVCIETNDRYTSYYRAIGLRQLLIGADAVIDIDTFVEQTVHNKYFRNIVNRFEKQQFSFVISSPPHSQAILAEATKVSASWLRLPHRKEWSFVTGKLDHEYLQQVPICMLKDSSGVTQSFVNQLPSFKPGYATIDLMRHRVDAPPNSMDYLFICLLKHLHKEGYDKFNLGISPLDSNPRPSEHMARLLKRSYTFTDTFIGFRGLHQFKSKYRPQWEPRYAWYQGSIWRLPQYGLAIYRLMRKQN